MKGLQISTGAILLMTAGFLTQQIVMVSSAAYSMAKTCEYMAEGFIADPASCQGYGYCSGGKLTGTGTCPDGYLYNNKEGVCDVPSNVDCSVSDSKSACQFAPDQTFVVDPTDCSRYCYCNAQKAECTSCPAGQVFDVNGPQCVYPNSAYKCKADSICRLVPNKVFLGNPEKCGEWIGCLNGIGTPGTCNNGLYFNKAIGACQTVDPCNGAPSVNTDVGPGVSGPPQLNTNICKAYAAANAGTEYPINISDGVSCMGYYTCKTAEDVNPIWNKCPLGTHFNNNKCVTPYTYACPYDRCGNMNLTFVGAINTKCVNYLTCKNQTSQNSPPNYKGNECPKDRFFNEVSGECVSTSPGSDTYVLCPKVTP